MTAEELAEVVEDLVRSLAEDRDGDPTELRGAALCSFRRAGLLTTDAGVVITLKDGSEFRISVVRSRAGNIEEDDDTDDGTS